MPAGECPRAFAMAQMLSRCVCAQPAIVLCAKADYSSVFAAFKFQVKALSVPDGELSLIWNIYFLLSTYKMYHCFAYVHCLLVYA